MKNNYEGLKFMFLPLMAVVLSTLLGWQGLLSFWAVVSIGVVAVSPILQSASYFIKNKTAKEFWEGGVVTITLLAFYWASMVLYGVHNVAVLAYVMWVLASMPLLGVCWKCVFVKFKGE